MGGRGSVNGTNEIYKALFEHSPYAILIIEEERFVDCNSAAASMLRFPSKQALLDRYSGGEREGTLRAHPAEFSPPKQSDGRDSFEKAEQMMQIAIEQGSNRFEWDHVRADGEVFPVEVVLTAVDGNPNPIIYVMWHEITERRKLEQALRQTQRLESVGRLAGGIAHDFNNLLLVILNNAEILRAQLETSGQSDNLESAKEILGAGERAAALTRQLLTFSRGQPIQPKPTDLVEVVTGLSSLLERLIGEDIQFESHVPSEPVTVLADPSQIEQLVVNLAANGRDAMPDGGCLRIELTRGHHEESSRLPGLVPGDYATIRVTDNGEGMTAEQIERAFDPFYTTKAPGSGSGLGLATVHSIAEQCGGGAWIESVIDEGTSLSVLIPVHDEEPVRELPKIRQDDSAGGNETILVAEDEEMIGRLIRRILEPRGYHVLFASDGAEALEAAFQHDARIDLVISDVVMPKLSGPELVVQLREMRPEIKVIFMSGYAQEGTLNTHLVGDDAEVIEKPFTTESLLSAIRRLLDEADNSTDKNTEDADNSA